MSSAQKLKVWTAVVDALVSTITVIITINISDESQRALIFTLLASYQVVAVALIVALTSTENAAIIAEAEVRTEEAYERRIAAQNVGNK